MPTHVSSSPGRRPQLSERVSSSQSLSRGSPTAGHTSTLQKGSSHKMHKAHAVGHVRHPHGRIPSYGKGLNKLSKLGPGNTNEGNGHTRHHTRSASHSPSTSPITPNMKRNSSNASLPRTESKASMKKTSSNVSLLRNRSAAKLGNQSKSDKAQTKSNMRRNGTDDSPLRGTAKFSVGGEDQDDNWTEDSNSLSPQTTRHSSVGRKTPQLEAPPSPDEPSARSPQNLPQSPPQSPPTSHSALAESRRRDQHKQSTPYSHPPNAEDVTYRLLNRSSHNAAPQLTSASATITPNGPTGSPTFNHSHDSTLNQESSMPADGISRFLGGTGSNWGSATPGSISHLQSNLVHISRQFQQGFHRPSPPTSSKTAAKPGLSRRVQSASNLAHPRLNDSESSSVSPPKAIPPPPPPNANKPPPRVSPFESARGNDPSAGKSLTQLKLDLQRMSTQRDTPSSQHPVMQHGSVIGIQNLSAGSSEMANRLARQYQQATVEFRNCRRFYPNLLVGDVAKKGVAKKIDAIKSKTERSPVASAGSSGDKRGRVRFELGRSSQEADREESGQGEAEEKGGVEDLLRRMWESGEAVGATE